MQVRRFAPALLLLAVVSGLFTMHTVGHLATHAGMAYSAGAPPAALAHGHADQQMSPARAADPETATVDDPGGLPGLPGDLMAVCVAILTAVVAIAVAFILLRRSRAGFLRPHRRSELVATGSRAPPRPNVGLRLADLSVLRN